MMDPLILAFMAESQAEFHSHTLTPTWPLARELYMRDNHIPAEMEEAEHGK